MGRVQWVRYDTGMTSSACSRRLILIDVPIASPQIPHRRLICDYHRNKFEGTTNHCMVPDATHTTKPFSTLHHHVGTLPYFTPCYLKVPYPTLLYSTLPYPTLRYHTPSIEWYRQKWQTINASPSSETVNLILIPKKCQEVYS